MKELEVHYALERIFEKLTRSELWFMYRAGSIAVQDAIEHRLAFLVDLDRIGPLPPLDDDAVEHGS